MLYLSALIFIATVFVFLRPAAKHLGLALVFAFSATLYLIFTLFYLLADYLSTNGIDESVAYHLFVDVGGAGLEDFTKQLVIGLVGLLVSITAGSLIGYLAMRYGGRTSRRHLASLAFVPLAWVAHPGMADIYSLVKVRLAESTTSRPEQFVPPPSALSFEQPKNLIYFYLESLEATYFDESVFPGLLPNLKRIREKSYSFDNIRQADSTGWTIAGMVASQCGAPLIRPIGGRNEATPEGGFFSKAVCMGDLLSNAGYTLSYMGGADLDFAGKGEFYRDHSFDVVKGLDELKHRVDPGYLTSWGLYDDSLFIFMREELDRLSSQNEPYAFYGLTLDTHHPFGHIPDSCEDLVYGDDMDPMLNAIHCSDKLVGELYDWLESTGKLENTTLVLASDHFAMRNTVWYKLEVMDRHNLLMIVDSDLPRGNNDKIGTTLDIAPTLLTTLGHEIDAYGYGRSLWKDSVITSNPDNHVLEMGLIFAQGRGYLKSLWSDRSVELANQKLKEQNRSQDVLELTGDLEFQMSRLNGLKIALAQPRKSPNDDALLLTTEPSSTSIELYGFDGSAVHPLLAVDLCEQHDLVRMKSLKETALDLDVYYDSYIVTGHMPENCAANNPELTLSKLFINSGLADWTRILQDQHYAGVVFIEGTTLEVTAAESNASTIRFVN